MRSVDIEAYDDMAYTVDQSLIFLSKDDKDRILTDGEFRLESDGSEPQIFSMENIMDMLEHVIIPSINEYGEEHQKHQLIELVNKMECLIV